MFNYTYSKELDDLVGVRDPNKDFLEKGPGTIDHPTVLSATFVYQLPFGAGHALNSGSHALNAIISHWQLSGIFTYAGGRALIDHWFVHRWRDYRRVLLSELCIGLFGKRVAERHAGDGEYHYNLLSEQGGLRGRGGLHGRQHCTLGAAGVVRAAQRGYGCDRPKGVRD